MSRSPVSSAWALSLPLWLLAMTVHAGDRAPPAGYDWQEYRIAMRDGVHLYTAVLAPPDKSKDYPILMERTPYGASPHETVSFTSLPEPEFLKSGFIFVFQDVRGRYQSEGVFTQNTPQKREHRRRSDVDESTDTYDTIDWLVHHLSNNNHRVAPRGCSSGGFLRVV